MEKRNSLMKASVVVSIKIQTLAINILKQLNATEENTYFFFFFGHKTSLNGTFFIFAFVFSQCFNL